MSGLSGTVLILGGTAEARALAAALADRGECVVSSLAGRVSEPTLPAGTVRIGGFGGPEGLRTWLSDNDCRAVVDATHPFARRISENAAGAARSAGLPLVRLQRPAWSPEPGDRWIDVDDMDAAAAAVADRGERVFLTTGRQDVGVFAGIDHVWFLIRVVDPPESALPRQHLVLRSRGPYHLPGEQALLRDHRIDLLVTKNSGGEYTRPKLRAAAQAGVRVVMVRRPEPVTDGEQVTSVGAVLAWLARLPGRPVRG